VTPSAEFDATRLDRYLAERLGVAAGGMAMERIAGGQSNPTFFVDIAGQRLVLRKQPAGEILPSAHAVDREFRVMEALAGAGAPVPKMTFFCDDRAVIGTPFYVMERVDGRVFHDCSLPGMQPSERHAAYLSAAQTLASLHAVDFGAIGLSDYGRPGDYFARQIARWARQWNLSKTRELPDIERLIAWLPHNIPLDETAAIVHGDYRMGNLMFHPTEPRVVAILDWELSTLGHPLADLAHACIGWHSLASEYGGLMDRDLASLGIPSELEYIGAYRAASNLALDLRPFHMAFALFRFAIIFEGIAARAKRGNAAGANASDVGALSEAFARRAIDVVDGRAHV
jgi:aminoglycoside phosphotransferase (APT) family kinase protein